MFKNKTILRRGCVKKWYESYICNTNPAWAKDGAHEVNMLVFI